MPCAGILFIKGNKIFKTIGKKHYYRCQPFDKKDPLLLIPFTVRFGFNKCLVDRYVLYEKSSASSMEALPLGRLIETLGPVTEKKAFLAYLLWGNGLFFPKMKCPRPLLEIDPVGTHGPESRRVFTIDPVGCSDFDDAIAVEGNIVSIYIANVAVFLEQTKLWDNLSGQCNTIYLPEETRHLLHPDLSQKSCSLVADGTWKQCIALEWDLSTTEYRFSITQVLVDRNFVYEEDALHTYGPYQDLLKLLSVQQHFEDSHEVVAYLMVRFNTFCATRLQKGIFRSTVPVQCPWALYPFVGEYTKESNLPHEGLGLKRYGHFSSPIRRIVDIVNTGLLLEQEGLYFFGTKAHIFFENVQKNIPEWNRQCRAIQQVEARFKLFEILSKNQVSTLESTGTIVSMDPVLMVHFEGYKTTLPLQHCSFPVSVSDRLTCGIHLVAQEGHFFKKVQINALKVNREN